MNLFKKVIPIALFLPSIVLHSAKLPLEFDGYITNVASPTKFDVSQRHIFCDAQTQLFLQYLVTGNQNEVALATTLDKTPFRVGMHIYVKGTFSKNDKDIFTAKSVKIFLNPNRDPHPEQQLSGDGLIQQQPQINKGSPGLEGTIWVDGYPLQVAKETKLLSANGDKLSLGDIHPDLWATYQAVRHEDNSILAKQIKFAPNNTDQEEKSYREKSEPKIELPDYENHTPGKIKSSAAWTFNILPDKDIQDYVSRIGSSLIPPYQKNFSSSEPNKINFRFFVVQQLSIWKDHPTNDVSAYNNGLILIPANILANLDNEAQLAALLANAISVVLEKQLYYHRTRIKTQDSLNVVGMLGGIYTLPLAIGNSISTNKLMLQINEKGDRVGLQYLLHAGYDIREAPFAFVVTIKHPHPNPMKPGHVVPDRVQSLMDDLRLDYPSTDYANLQCRREAYQQMLSKMRTAFPKLVRAKKND